MYMGEEFVGADAELDDILAAVSGDSEIIGAIGAINPQAAMKLRAAVNRRRNVVALPSSGQPLNTHLPLVNGNGAVAAGASVSLTGTPLRNFKPNGFFVQTDGPAVTVDSVTIANMPQFGSAAGVVASDAFKRDAVVPYELDWQVVPQNQSIIAACTNRHAATACAIFGAVFGKYTIS